MSFSLFRRSTDLLLNSKILVGIVAVVFFIVGVLQVLQGFIDPSHVRAQVIQIVKEKTGKDLIIKGRPSVVLLPLPTVYLPNVELRDAQNEIPMPVATADVVRLRISPLTLFSSHPRVSGVILETPKLAVERAHDGTIHWDWLNTDLLKALLVPTGNESVSFYMINGRIRYDNDITGKETDVRDISASGAIGAEMDMSGSFSIEGHELNFAMSHNANIKTDLPMAFRLYTDRRNEFVWHGDMDFSSDVPKFKGSMKLVLEDIFPWLHQPEKEKKTVFGMITNTPVAPIRDATKFTVTATGDWSQEGLVASLSSVQWQGVNSTGSGDMKLTWAETPSAEVNMEFSEFDYNQWEMLVNRLLLLQAKDPTSAAVLYKENDEVENPLPSGIAVDLDLKMQKLTFGSEHLQNVRLQSSLEDASLTVNQFSLDLPGDTTLSLFGVVSQGTARGLRFEGSTEAKGKSLRQLLTIFDPAATGLPENGFGDFYARSNIFISPEQIRLSEADVKISELHLNGGLVAYFDANPRVEADVRLKDINFDYFRDVWRKSGLQSGDKKFELGFDSDSGFNWLRKLHTTVDFKVNIDRFTFLERKGESAAFRLNAKDGILGIYDIRFYYPGDVLEASFRLNVQGEQPYLNILLNTAEFNVAYLDINPPFLEKPATKQDVQIIPQAETVPADPTLPAGDVPIPSPSKPSAPAVAAMPAAETESIIEVTPPRPIKKDWEQDLIDMNWMNGWGGTFDLSIGRLTYGNIKFDNVKLRSTLEKNMLIIQGLGLTYWQGRWDMTGSIYGGTVPGVQLAFTLYSGEVHELMHSLFDRDNITGKVSVSGGLATSGVNYLSWLSQAEAKLVFSGRGIVVDGVNLQGVVDAVGVSRTASDVLNNVNLALVNGSTEFAADGNINIKNGVMRTPGIALKSATITGNLTGEVKLVPWTMSLSSLYQFPSLPSETVPTLFVQLAGPIGAPELQTDTASLEAYVAKRIVGR